MNRWMSALLACAALTVMAAPHAQATFAGANGKIAYTNADTWSEEDRLFLAQLYAVDPDGSDLTKLTSVGPYRTAGWPLWSPRGDRMAYVATSTLHSDEQELYVINPDGSDPRIWGGGDLGAVRWSPDGARIAYTDDNSDGDDVFVTGGSYAQLSSGFGVYSSPTWSPDGQWVAFDALNEDDPADNGIFVTRPGAQKWQLTLDGSTPSWSPRGDKIAFQRADGLYTMRPDGSQIGRLTRFVGRPYWSPTGRHIAFTTYPNPTVNVMRADGGRLKRVAAGAHLIGWSPDGRRLALLGDADGAIYMARADGSRRKRVAARGTGFAWSPDSLQLAYAVNSAGGCQIRVVRHDGRHTRTIVGALPPCDFGEIDWQTR